VIAGAALLVLLGLGLFVAGILTGMTWFYWACVASCAVAAVLLVVTRRRMATEGTPRTAQVTSATSSSAAARRSAAAGGPAGDAPVTGAVPARAVTSDAVAGNGAHAGPAERGDPPVEDVEVTDLLLVVDLKDEVLVIDEHPRYHLAGCRYLAGHETIPLPLDEARTDGFTPCAVCAPDRNFAERARARKAADSA
jgi:hypothetical protein